MPRALGRRRLVVVAVTAAVAAAVVTGAVVTLLVQRPAPTAPARRVAPREPVATIAAAVEVSTDKNRYAPAEPIVVSWAGMPGNAKHWVTVVAAGSADTVYRQWTYTQGSRDGKHSFSGLNPGRYEVRVFFDWPSGGHTVRERYGFEVVAEVSR